MMLLLVLQLLYAEVRPQVCTAPCSVVVTTRVTHHQDNKWLVIELDGPELHTFEMELDGVNSSTIQPPFEVKNLPTGNYTVKIILYQRNPRSEAARKEFSLWIR